MSKGTLVLSRRDVAALMTPSDYLEAVTQGFRALAEGRVTMPPPLHVALAHGGFHAKAASLERSFVVLKFNANMPGNPLGHGLPTIQGALLLCDGDNGRLLAVMDSIELTLRRTAAATALAARYLAPPHAGRLAVCGCGAQALPQIEALVQVLPLREVWLWDLDAARARALREQLAAQGALQVHLANGLEQATQGAEVVVTCTTSAQAFLAPDDVAAGSFIAAVGADSPHKSEITPALMAGARVVVDSLAQCEQMGDLHHAVRAGAMRAEQVHAELADLVGGRKTGRESERTSDDQTWIFDSTGLAVQDMASAAAIYTRAVELGVGTRVDLGSV